MPLWVKYTSIQIIPQYCVNEIEVLIIRYMYDTLKVGPTVIHLPFSSKSKKNLLFLLRWHPSLCNLCVKHLSFFVSKSTIHVH